MPRYFLDLAFSGRNYKGWQVQSRKDAQTVQGVLNQALSTLLDTEVKCNGAGRTDTGVHARQFYAHFDSEEALDDDLTRRLNLIIPPDIVIRRILPVADRAHARFDAVSRSYEYYIHRHKDPFLFDSSFYYPFHPVQIGIMNKAASMLSGFSNFKPLSRKKLNVKTYACRITEAQWHWLEATGQWRFTITSDRFLRGMVRRIVGTMLLISKGTIDLHEFGKVMNETGVFSRSLSVPPNGLFLTAVRYPFLAALGLFQVTLSCHLITQ